MRKNILEKIISISGKPGLFKPISKTRNVVIAELINYKKKTSANSFRNISLLDKIQICCLLEEFFLNEIFEKIFQYKSDKKIRINLKSNSKFLEAYFFKVFRIMTVTRYT